jgi:hypothetical protein
MPCNRRVNIETSEQPSDAIFVVVDAGGRWQREPRRQREKDFDWFGSGCLKGSVPPVRQKGALFHLKKCLMLCPFSLLQNSDIHLLAGEPRSGLNDRLGVSLSAHRLG